MGFPCGSAGKESACSEGDMGLIPGFGRSPGEGKGYSLQYSGLEDSMDYSPWDHKESDTTEGLPVHFQEAHGKMLAFLANQCSCVTPVSSSVVKWSCLCGSLSLRFLFSWGYQSYWTEDPSYLSQLITSAKTLISKSVHILRYDGLDFGGIQFNS